MGGGGGGSIQRRQRDRGTLGYGSLPRPEEHFPADHSNTETAPNHRSVIEEEEDVPTAAMEINEWAEAVDTSIVPHSRNDDRDDDHNHRLAVDTAIAPDNDKPEYVYRAIEYDPEAKPPLHRNRRYRGMRNDDPRLRGLDWILHDDVRNNERRAIRSE